MRAGRVVFDVHPESSIELPLADRDLTIGKSFAYSVARFGPRPAMVYDGQTWSYDELAAEVEQCARSLIAAGVGKGTRVGIVMGSRPEFAVLAYATAMIGGVCVFISTFSTGDELDWILRHSDAALLVMHATVRSHEVVAEFVARHPAVLDDARGVIADIDLPYLRRVVVVANSDKPLDPRLETWESFHQGANDADARLVGARCAEVHPDDDAVILYTSGSASVPKAVLHVHRAPTMQSFHMADAMAIGADDRTWTSFPVFWTAGWLTAVASPLVAGACVVLQEFYDPHEALELLERHRVTCVRQMVHDEMRLVEAHAAQPRDLSSVSVGVVTESLRVLTSVPEDISELCAWGMTETFTNATMLAFDEPLELRTTTMGRPVPGNRIRIRDRETDVELAPGEVGEITVNGRSTMRAYYKSDDPLPLDAAGFLPTNDAGYLTADGLLVFAGRLDRLIKTRGVNVSPIEIEERLLEWGRVGTCAVLGVPHPTLDQAVVLCVSPRVDEPVTAEQICDHLRSRLASYKVPQRVVFFDETDFPLTVSGKVHIGQLRGQLVARLLEDDIDDNWKQEIQRSVQ